MNWSNENYAMQRAMSNMGMMNMMSGGQPPHLPTPMCFMPEMPSTTEQSHPQLDSVQRTVQSSPPDTTNQDLDEDAMTIETGNNNDVTSTQSSQSDRYSNNFNKRDREKGRSRSRENDKNHKDKNDRRDRNKRNDRKSEINQRERQSKWGDRDLPNPGLPGGMNMPGNMMMPPAFPTMLQPPNMMPNMPGNMMIPPAIGPGPMNMMPPMAMMNNMMPNMMDQSMMMMNPQMMPMMGNHMIYLNSGVLLPPLPGAHVPPRREKPKGCRTIFVGGLPADVTFDTLNEIFQRFGNIENIKSPKTSSFCVRFENIESVEQSFFFSGHRFKFHNQSDNEATTMFVDYASNRDDQSEYEKQQRKRESTPPRVEHFSASALSSMMERIKSEEEFVNVAATLANWLERGECNKKNANSFYSLIQVSNNQIRRLFNEKMQLDDEFNAVKATFREKFSNVLLQFEQVAKILSAAKHQRVSDHFTKQQRRNIEMWLKMTEDVENIREEFHATFDDDDIEKGGKNAVPLEKYEELKMENENLTYELQGYKNEAHMAKDEAERKFETFKAHFIAQQALQNNQPMFPVPTPPPTVTKSEENVIPMPPVPPSEAKLISILTAFLMVHPLGASIDYLTSYVRSLIPHASQANVKAILVKYEEVFKCKTTGVGASIDRRWTFATFDGIRDIK